MSKLRFSLGASVFSEPKKQWGRCKKILQVFPKAYREEKQRKKAKGL